MLSQRESMKNKRPPRPSTSRRSRSNGQSYTSGDSSGSSGRNNSGRSSRNSSSRNSNSPSNSSNNEHGRDELDARLRSLLHHPLGLPLLFAMNRQKMPAELEKHLPPLRCNEGRESFSDVFGGCVRAWTTARKNATSDGTKKPDERNLTKTIADAINSISSSLPFSAHEEMNLSENSKVYGKIDIALSPKEGMETSEGSTPLMVMEVGLDSREWFRKLDQGMKYLLKMCMGQENKLARFEKPLLFSVITIDDYPKDHVVFQMGVFLCTRKDHGNFRMALLQQFKTNSQKKASDFFGRMLWLTKEINQRRDEAGQNTCGYQYFSSNCCKIGDQVVRIYDNRFRQTQRTSVVYLNCGDIVGKSSEILSLKRGEEDSINGFNTSAIKQGEPVLTIISAPYYEGGHIASKPSDFVPIIQQLQELHKNGYVHGDIRAFNTIIGGEKKSWLIDFDFGGKANEVTYPSGYRKILPDGRRLGKDGDKILPCHDWYALGVLIFNHYDFLAPHRIGKEGELKMKGRRLDLLDKWRDPRATEKKEEDLEELTDFLNDADTAGYALQEIFLEECMEKDATAGTFQGATGSPPKKNA